MTKFWRVAWYEYRRHVFRVRFLLALLGLPLMIGLIFLVFILLILSQLDRRPVGFVDRSGLLTGVRPGPAEPGAVQLHPFSTIDEARAALEAGGIQGYYLLGEDFEQTLEARYFYLKGEPPLSAEDQLEGLLRERLFANQPPQVLDRLTEGFDFVTRLPDDSHQPAWVSSLLRLIIPLVTGFAFLIAIFTSSGYLMQAVVEEKENRTMEVLVTSLPPGKLIAGKIVGIGSVGLTQILVWTGLIVAPLLLARQAFDWTRFIRFEPTFLLILGLVVLPAYLMIAALMTAIGATVTKASEGQQVTGILTLPVMMPYWFTPLLVSNPNSPLALILSIIPFTAPVAMTLRSGATVIPLWQILLQGLVMFLATAAAIWLAGRAFRLGMLRYGQPLRWRELFGQK